MIILGLSGVGLGVLLGGDFAGFYLFGYGAGNRSACLTCEYNASFPIAAIIIGTTVLGIQALLALNELLPTRVFKAILLPLLLILAYATVVVLVAGLVDFGIEYEEFEWGHDGVPGQYDPALEPAGWFLYSTRVE